jgi:hypothetical protein
LSAGSGEGGERHGAAVSVDGGGSREGAVGGPARREPASPASGAGGAWPVDRRRRGARRTAAVAGGEMIAMDLFGVATLILLASLWTAAILLGRDPKGDRYDPRP